MANRAGLKKITKTVKGKKGAVRRSYWVKAKDAAKGVGGFLNRHKGKILGAAALAGTAYLAHRKYKSNLASKATPFVKEGREHVAAAIKSVKGAESAHIKSKEALKAKRNSDAMFRRIQSELRRTTAAAARSERGDTAGAQNILNRESHLNLRKAPPQLGSGTPAPKAKRSRKK